MGVLLELYLILITQSAVETFAYLLLDYYSGHPAISTTRMNKELQLEMATAGSLYIEFGVLRV